MALVLTVLSVAGAFSFGYLPMRSFDSAKWKGADYWDGTRIEMIEHLKVTGKLDGLHRSEVVSLLGPETDTSHFSDFELVYQLGPERGFLSLDSEWLVIDLNDKGVVANYQVVRD